MNRRVTLIFGVLISVCISTDAFASDKGSGSSGSGSSGSGKGGSGSGSSSTMPESSSSTPTAPPTVPSTVATSAPSTAPASVASTAPTNAPSTVPPPAPVSGPPAVTIPPVAVNVVPSVGIAPPAPTPTLRDATPTIPTSPPVTTSGSKKESRIVRTSKCGSKTMTVELRTKDQELRVRTSVSPRSDTTWSATILQDRRIVWRGVAKRGAVDRKLTKLSGAEVVAIRLASTTGAICALEVVVTS
jgi:hypothetical protein